jgi:hypothetical protein
MIPVLLSVVLVLPVSESLVAVRGAEPKSSVPLEGTINIDNSYVSVPEFLVSAIADALGRRPADLLKGTQFALTSARLEGSWALVSIASLDGPNSDARYVGAGSSGGLAIATRNGDGSWQAALQGTDEFSPLLDRAPARFVSPGAQTLLTLDPDSTETPSSVEYKFPWASGLSWTWTQSWHSGHHDMGTSGSDKRLLASAAGVVTYICWGTLSVNVQIQDADGVVMGYSHIDRNTLESCISVGVTIPRGQVLGSLRPDTWSDNCGYTSQNPSFAHVHWGIPTDRAVTVDGWTIQYPNNYWEKDGSYKYVWDSFPSTNQPVYGCPNCCCSGMQSACSAGQSCQNKSDEFPTGFVWETTTGTDMPQERMAEAESEGPLKPVDAPQTTETDLEAIPPQAGVRRIPLESQRTPPTSTSFRIPKSVFGSDGRAKSSTHYVMNSTQGQSTNLSRRTSASYVLLPGYWGPSFSSYRIYLPLVVRNW